ncbi:FecR domain-containing protein [Pseudothauera rhizosphaerae]|uniref:DUF4880 domain-containing protein n=1 Tax=Pseudothauera rhizosphaerae TaxID=2565932 RepID=A0A4S4AQS4_9RHOO|nr:FecR domain-containing protein [Pseudothauera rhizosphaerae]THF62047.1 DUF4880 domain-containing protein [Pseudothauera rhizosphaerae]
MTTLPDTIDPTDDASPLPEAVTDQAIRWYVRLSSGLQTDRDTAEFTRWHAAHSDHARAWKRLQNMGSRLQSSAAQIPAPLARGILRRIGAACGTRRAFIRGLIVAGSGGAALHLAQGQIPLQTLLAGTLADARTATGQRQRHTLADGTQLLLNTATAVDVRYSAHERRIVLLHGEIMVGTAPDDAGRPLLVATPHGILRPVGTRFSVRHDGTAGHATEIAVAEGAVDIHPAALAKPLRLNAGQQTRFTPHHVDAPAALDESRQSWTTGTLSAEGMRLADFIAELDRHRPGRLRCAPEVAGLRITGSWPLEGPDPADPTAHILASLERHMPVRIRHLTRYWVSVEARPAG